MVSVVDYARDDNHGMLSLLMTVPAAVPEKHREQALLVTARAGFWECAKVLLFAGVPPDTSDSNGNTCLLEAAGAGHTKVLEQLLSAGCDVNTRNYQDSTALHAAAQHGHKACVQVLLSAGASQHVRQRQGCTPLILATRNVRRASGALALMTKAATGDTNVLDAQDDQGRTALHWACSQGLGVQALLDAGASAELPDKQGNTPLMLAAVEGLDGVIYSLANTTSCNPNLPNNHGKYPVHFLAMKNHPESIRQLVHVGCNINVLDSGGRTPLWYAVNHNRPEAVKALLKANCLLDPPVQSEGDTVLPPLRLSLEKHLYGIARLLVLAGCQVVPLYGWLEKVRQARNDRGVERQATLWVEGREADSDEEEQDQEEEEAEDWFDDWLHSPHSLRQLCRITIRRRIGHHILKHAADLPLPKAMQDYVTLKEVEDHHVPGWLIG